MRHQSTVTAAVPTTPFFYYIGPNYHFYCCGMFNIMQIFYFSDCWGDSGLSIVASTCIDVVIDCNINQILTAYEGLLFTQSIISYQRLFPLLFLNIHCGISPVYFTITLLINLIDKFRFSHPVYVNMHCTANCQFDPVNILQVLRPLCDIWWQSYENGNYTSLQNNHQHEIKYFKHWYSCCILYTSNNWKKFLLYFPCLHDNQFQL